MSVTEQTTPRATKSAMTCTGAPTWSEMLAVRRRARRALTREEIAMLGRYRNELGGRVLEIGCTGDSLTTWLALNASSYTGVSSSAAVRHLCMQRLAVAEFCHQADLVGYADGYFDAVIVTGIQGVTANYCDTLRREIARLLIPGGALIFARTRTQLSPAARF